MITWEKIFFSKWEKQCSLIHILLNTKKWNEVGKKNNSIKLGLAWQACNSCNKSQAKLCKPTKFAYQIMRSGQPEKKLRKSQSFF